MKRVLATLHILGLTMVMFALTMLIPLGVAYIGGDAARDAFLHGFLISVGIGVALAALTRRARSELRARDGFVLVSAVWAGLPLLAAIPLLIYFHRAGLPLSFTGAYFEAMSGLTTTGATVLTNLDALPPSINLWRATLVWIGGMGILVLAVAILPLLGVGGHQVVRAETPGPMKDERLTPRIASTAKALYAVYFAFSILCFLAYRAVGLSWFEAWCHMATTMGLGGFSTWDDGFAHFDSVAVEMVAMVFMLIAGINFATHFNAFRQRSGRAYLRCPEAIPYLVVVLGVGLVISVFLYVKGVYQEPLEALRYGMFNTISMATTTGYANTDFAQWPLFAPLTMLLLSGFATSAGSTGGGIKTVSYTHLDVYKRQGRGSAGGAGLSPGRSAMALRPSAFRPGARRPHRGGAPPRPAARGAFRPSGPAPPAPRSAISPGRSGDSARAAARCACPRAAPARGVPGRAASASSSSVKCHRACAAVRCCAAGRAPARAAPAAPICPR